MIYFIFTFFSTLSFANDASSSIGVGGLEPKKNTVVQMESEVLKISPTLISIDYVFYNPSQKDETVLVSFPLPDIDVNQTETLINALRSTGKKDPKDIVGFSVSVNGKTKKFQTEQKAMLGNKDVTALLKESKLSIFPWFSDPKIYAESLRKLTPEQKKNIVKAGLVAANSLENEKTNIGNGDEWDPRFLYVVKTQFYWKQTFPKKSRTKIHHEYIPMTGSAYGPNFPNKKEELERIDEEGFCGTQSDFLASNVPKDSCKSHQDIEYILTTAKTWKGNIKKFTLELKDMRFVFTCFEKIKRVDATNWKFTAQNYSPKDDLKIAFCN
jgi:hypothetical protein